MRYFAILAACLLALIVMLCGPGLGRLASLPMRLWSATGEWRTPIQFYGKVVDENGSPVPNATVDFTCNDVSSSGTSNYRRTSDNNGLFSISRIRGKLLVVHVAKVGYYTSRADNAAFCYAGENVNFVPNLARPELFHLKRIGNAEPLVYVKNNFRMSTNGDSVQISLRKGRVVEQGQADLRIECWMKQSPGSRNYDWRCRITVIGGGLQEFTNEFPFEAPLRGYRTMDEVDMPISLGEKWASSIRKSYFLQLAGKDYARMNLEVVPAGDHFFEVESLLNPSGSRNLEFDPNKIVQISD